jgi:hypothetical protein
MLTKEKEKMKNSAIFISISCVCVSIFFVLIRKDEKLKIKDLFFVFLANVIAVSKIFCS